MTPRSIILLCAVCLLVAGCAGETAPTLAPEPTAVPSYALALVTASPTLTPEERGDLYQVIMDAMVGVAAKGGWEPPTTAELVAACDTLEKHQWDMGYDFFTDPDLTLRTSSIAGGLFSSIRALGDITEKRGYDRYHASDFCRYLRETVLSLAPKPTPLPTDAPAVARGPSPTFRPGERAYRHELVKEIMSDAWTDMGNYPGVTSEELRTACAILRRNDWDLAAFYSDPGTNERLSMIAGGVSGVLFSFQQESEEQGLPTYTVVHFCNDAETSRAK